MITPGFSTSYVQTPVSKRSHSKEGSTMERVCHSRLESRNRCRNSVIIPSDDFTGIDPEMELVTGTPYLFSSSFSLLTRKILFF